MNKNKKRNKNKKKKKKKKKKKEKRLYRHSDTHRFAALSALLPMAVSRGAHLTQL